MHKNTILRSSALAAAASLLLSACQMFPTEEELPAAPVIRSYETVEYKQTAVIRGDLTLIDKVQCEYVPVMKENLCFKLGGEYIERIYVTEGQQVSAGEVLAELTHGDLMEDISSQEYEIQVLELKRTHLLEDQTLALRKLEIQEAGPTRVRETNESYEKQIQEIDDSLYIHRLQLQELQDELSNRQIVAGFNGSVTFVRDFKNGERSVEDRIMVTVADMSTTAFTVKGEKALYFPVGTQVTITCNKQELTAESVEASALGITSLADSDTPVAYLKLDQPDPTLEDGDRGTIQVTLDSRTDVLYVSKDAVKTADGRQFVYILNEEGLKVMHDVTTGLESGKYIEIIDGLAEGDSVILE